MKNFDKFASIQSCLLVVSTLLVGCVSSGTISGVSDGKTVQFEYEQGHFDNDGVLKITMPDGEYFSGKFVQQSTSTSGNDWEIGESSDDDAFILKDSTTRSSQTHALLIGNQGNTMNCQFQFADPEFGIDGGGIGTCQVSNGEAVSVSF